MKAYQVVFVYEDSSTTQYTVLAESEKCAVNTVLNRNRITKTHKFVIVSDFCLTQSEDDIDLVENFECCGDDLYKFDNVLSSRIDFDYYTVKLGDLQDFENYIHLIGRQETNKDL